MSNISDMIESYLKKLLSESQKDSVEIRRSELAVRFSCVPSQINYVLGTRFTTEQGYLVESRRGGGGYVRIIKSYFTEDSEIYNLINELQGKMVNQYIAGGLIERLVEEGFLTIREGLLMRAVIQNEVLGTRVELRDLIRGNILRTMLLTLFREEFQD